MKTQESKEDYLPLGTVVLLKNSRKRLMITGYCQRRPEDEEKIYEYCGCLYPEGYLDANQVYLFDRKQIDDIIFYGYVDAEAQIFFEKLGEVWARIDM